MPQTVAAWTPEIGRAQGPLYLAIANALAGAIGRGELQPGERLPPHRALASALGVDLTTVTRAYTEARRRGLLDAATGRGTFVRRDVAPPAGARPTVVDMSMNLPPLPAEPDLREMLRDGVARLLRHEDVATLMAYRTGAGTAQDRAAGAAWLAPNLGAVPPGRVLVCPGAQSAIHAVLTTIAQPGDGVVTEALAYPGLRAVAAHLGLTVLGVPLDSEGMIPEALDAICRERRPRAIYCTPTIQNPTTCTMSDSRRAAIAAVAERHGIAVIEDDAYGLLPEAPPSAIARLVPDLTYYVATTAKCLSPGLRTAFLVVPSAALATRVMGALRAATMMASPLLLGLVTLWIREGVAGAVRDGIRREAAARQAIARAMLPPGSFAAHPEGLHVWLSLPSYWSRPAFVAYVRDRGLALVPSDAFQVSGLAPNAVRVALGVAPDRERLAEALGAITEALRQKMPSSFADVV